MATFVRKFDTKTFQKQPNLVTLNASQTIDLERERAQVSFARNYSKFLKIHFQWKYAAKEKEVELCVSSHSVRASERENDR